MYEFPKCTIILGVSRGHICVIMFSCVQLIIRCAKICTLYGVVYLSALHSD